jgi:hypothetical protein
MSNSESLANGIEVLYAFGETHYLANKKIVFLAGTTSWQGNLVKHSWRRHLLKQLAQEKNLSSNIVLCVPEPKYGYFVEQPEQHLIEWESKYLDLASVHVFWLNTYWTYEQAIKGTNQETELFFADGQQANIGITVRSELGASLARYYYQPHNFKLIVGCPQDARGLDWLFIQSQLKNIPIHRLANKQKVYDDEWYQEILHTLQRL